LEHAVLRKFPWARLIAAALLAYPISGALVALKLIITYELSVPAAHLTASGRVSFDLFYVLFSAFITSATAGFIPPIGGGSAYINMYPWIIPTAIALFFILSKGWRWFEKDKSEFE
jgi:hypothetical protein